MDSFFRLIFQETFLLGIIFGQIYFQIDQSSGELILCIKTILMQTIRYWIWINNGFVSDRVFQCFSEYSVTGVVSSLKYFFSDGLCDLRIIGSHSTILYFTSWMVPKTQDCDGMLNEIFTFNKGLLETRCTATWQI